MSRPSTKRIIHALAEVSFIVFLFYTNLLMGEFTRSHSVVTRTVLDVLSDVFTLTNVIIGLVGAIIGYFCIEGIRKRLL
jgi:hypothetical protein